MGSDQIFRVCLPQEDLELINFGGYLAMTFATTKLCILEFLGVLTFVGVPQTKLMNGFSPNFQDMLTKTETIASRFGRVSDNTCCQGNA